MKEALSMIDAANGKLMLSMQSGDVRMTKLVAKLASISIDIEEHYGIESGMTTPGNSTAEKGATEK